MTVKIEQPTRHRWAAVLWWSPVMDTGIFERVHHPLCTL